MNRLFYIIYNSYYKNGEYKDDTPSLTVGGIFLICFFCSGLSILNIIGWVDPLYYHMKLSKTTVFLEIILFGSIVYFLFYHNKRYQRIYEKYKEDAFLNSQLAKFIGFFIVILIMISPFMLALVHDRIFLGHWMRIS